MKVRVISIHEDTPVVEAAQICVKEHIGTLPIINESNQLIGIIMIYDLLRIIMPDFLQTLENFDYIQDLGAIEDLLPTFEEMSCPVRDVMEEPVWVEADSGLMRAFSLLHSHHLNDIPVVDKNHILVGIASRVDLGVMLLTRWENANKRNSSK